MAELAARVLDTSRLEGVFRLRSGGTSTLYFDKYRFESDPALLREICAALAPQVPEGTDALAGLELGGVPTLRLQFENGATRTVDFSPVLAGELYGPLADEEAFDGVRLDEEAHTLVWPNGADFDPAMLYNWAEYGPALEKLAKAWHVSVK